MTFPAAGRPDPGPRLLRAPGTMSGMYPVAVYRVSGTRYLQVLLGVLPLMVVLSVAATLPVLLGGFPYDLTMPLVVLAFTIVVGTPFAALFKLADRSRVLVDASGLTVVPFGYSRRTVSIPWYEVVELRARWTPIAWQVRVRRRHGTAVTLAAPQSVPWWPDRRFRRELAELQAWLPPAVPRPAPRPAGGLRALIWPALLVAVLLPAAPQAARYGVLGPWSAAVRDTPDACRLLVTAGLDRDLPHRSIERGTNLDADFDSCGYRSTDKPADAGASPDDALPVSYVRLVVGRYDGWFVSSSAASAARLTASSCARLSGAEPLDGAGDGGCLGAEYSSGSTYRVIVRRANLVLNLRVSGTHAESVARGLAGRLAESVRVG